MQQWSRRNPAVADLLNPALVATSIAAAADHYERTAGEPMPFELSFLLAPLVLHRDTRLSLPNRTDSHLTKWVSSHEVLSAGFGARAKSLVELTREGLRFGVRQGAIEFNGATITGNLRSKRPAQIGDVADVVKKAGFVGRWFAKLDSPATAFALLGVTV
ncbi:three component ABC system middle component [Rhodococcus koreensis]